MRLIYVFRSQSFRERGRERSHPSTAGGMEWQGLGQAKATDQKLNPYLPNVCWVPQHLGHLTLSSRQLAGSKVRNVVARSRINASRMGCRHWGPHHNAVPNVQIWFSQNILLINVKSIFIILMHHFLISVAWDISKIIELLGQHVSENYCILKEEKINLISTRVV